MVSSTSGRHGYCGNDLWKDAGHCPRGTLSPHLASLSFAQRAASAARRAASRGGGGGNPGTPDPDLRRAERGGRAGRGGGAAGHPPGRRDRRLLPAPALRPEHGPRRGGAAGAAAKCRKRGGGRPRGGACRLERLSGGGQHCSPWEHLAAPPRSDARRPWAWPRAPGGRRGGGGGGGGSRWRAAGPEPGRAMAASERLCEPRLRHCTQVSPPRPRPRCPQGRAPRTCYTCAPRAEPPGPRRRARAGGAGLRADACAWPLGDRPRRRAPTRPGTSPFHTWGN